MAGMRHIPKHYPKQTGFTVIELLTVVFILAIIAGSIVTALGPDFTEAQQETAAEFEMNQIGRAITAFQQDNPTFVLSERCTPAGATFLLLEDKPTNPTTTPCTIDTTHAAQGTDWDPEYRLGWRGPYLTKSSNELADIDTTIQFNGGTDGAPGTQLNVNVITDPYNNPYYFFDLDDNDSAAASGIAEPRIISLGPDGIYDGLNCTITDGPSDPDPCDTDLLCNSESDSDDIILCLDI